MNTPDKPIAEFSPTPKDLGEWVFIAMQYRAALERVRRMLQDGNSSLALAEVEAALKPPETKE